MILEKVAQRYAYDRPGYQLIDFIEVGLPVYRLALVASFLQEKKLATIDEFLMRSIECGLQSEASLAEFLGLDRGQIRPLLAELDANEIIYTDQTTDGPNVTLTAKGKRALATAATVTPKLDEVTLHFDGLTRALVPFQVESLWQYRQITAAGILEIASKPARRPTLHEVAIQDARTISAQLSEARGKSKRSLLAIKSLESANRFFQIGQVLLYKSSTTQDIDFTLIVDGLPSNIHKEALLRAGGLSRFGIKISDIESPSSGRIAGSLTSTQEANLKAGTEVAESKLEQAHLEASLKADRLDERSESAADNAYKSRLVDEAIAKAIADISDIHIRHIAVFEHATFLDDALRNSKERLLIISPWIRRQVLDLNRIRALRNLAEKGVRIYIGWGIGKGDRSQDNDFDVVTRLKGLHDEFANFYFVDLENTHEKILIKDDDFVIETSFNWLSFKGDPNRTMRFERGTYISIKSIVDAEFKILSARFSDAKQTAPSLNQLNALQARFGKNS